MISSFQVQPKGNKEYEAPVLQHFSKREREAASLNDYQQDTKKGRSKLKRWTNHKEQDLSTNPKLSSSSKLKEVDVNGKGKSSESNKVGAESAKPVVETTSKECSSPIAEDTGDLQSNGTEKAKEERHLDNVEKLKKRCERFKLPMPCDKDVMLTKKVESEALPPAKTETPTDLDVKPKWPARKRRWTITSSQMRDNIWAG